MDGMAVGPSQMFRTFVSKMKNENVVGNGSHVSLVFLRGGVAVEHLRSTNGEGWREGSVFPRGDRKAHLSKGQ